MRKHTSGANSFEYRVLNYAPSILSDKKVPIAVVISDSSDQDGRRCILRVAADWRQRVRDLDGDADLEILDSFLKEVQARLLRDPIEVMGQLEQSLSNTIQLSEPRKLRADLMPCDASVAATLRQGSRASSIAGDMKRQLVIWPPPTKTTVGA